VLALQHGTIRDHLLRQRVHRLRVAFHDGAAVQLGRIDRTRSPLNITTVSPSGPRNWPV
jgi:hypothetical protein